MINRSLGIVLLAIPALLFSTTSAQNTATSQDQQKRPEFTATLRWGRSSPESESSKITTALNSLFQNQSENLNFSKRSLNSLVEQAFPRQLGRLFPFRYRHSIPDRFFFENFAPIAFLVGELNNRVSPILAETETAEWLELHSRESVKTARELNPTFPVTQGLRALALQNPPSGEVFSTSWSKFFDQAEQLLEYGSIGCWKKAENKLDATSPILSAHVRCGTPLQTLTKENAIPKQLPRKISVVGNTNVSTQAPAVHPTCVPMGRLAMQTLELFGDEKGGHCLLWRASKDERFQQKALSSKLICLNSRHKSFQRTRFNSVVAILPSLRPDFLHVLESDDGLIAAYKLSLSTLSVSKEEVTNNLGQNLRQSVFPLNRTGVYACQQPSVPSASAFPLSENSTSNMEWIYLEDSLYAGLKPVRPDVDVAWRIKETSENTINFERLNWSQLQYDHPSISSERPFVCAASREIDANCGLRILQTGIQISEDLTSGEMERNGYPVQTQLAASLILQQALEKVMNALPDWALREETQNLNNFFAQKTRKLAANSVFSATPLRVERATTVKTPPAERSYLDLPRDSQEFLAIKKSISSPVDFWGALKQKPL